MTRKSINYNTHSSYGLKHVAEREIKDYVLNIQIIYILALRNVPYGYSNKYIHPRVNLYYPLSADFEKIRQNPIYRPQFRVNNHY